MAHREDLPPVIHNDGQSSLDLGLRKDERGKGVANWVGDSPPDDSGSRRGEKGHQMGSQTEELPPVRFHGGRSLGQSDYQRRSTASKEEPNF